MKKIYKNVELGKDAVIGDFVIIGLPPKGKKDGELKTVIGDNAVVRDGTIIYAGNIIGDNFQTGNSANIREKNKIGNNVSIGTKTVIEHKVVIEDDVRVHSQAFIPEFSVLKKGCWIGPNVVLVNAPFPLSHMAKEMLKGPVIEEDAKVGANSTILSGVNVGKNSLVGAGSVVTKDVPEKMVVVGNPAKPIKPVDKLKFKENNEKAYK